MHKNSLTVNITKSPKKTHKL